MMHEGGWLLQVHLKATATQEDDMRKAHGRSQKTHKAIEIRVEALVAHSGTRLAVIIFEMRKHFPKLHNAFYPRDTGHLM